MSSPVCVHIEEGLGKVSPSDSPTQSESNSQDSSSGGLKEHDYIGLSEVSSSMESSVVSCQDGEENNLNLKETELRLGLPGSLSPPRDSSPELSLLGPLKLRNEVVEEKKLFPIEKQQHSTKEGAADEKNGQERYTMQCSGAARNMMSPSAKSIVTGAKRGFSEAMESRNCFPDTRNNGGFSAEGKWMYASAAGGGVVPGSEVELPKGNPQGKFLPQGLASASGTPKGPTSWHTGGLDHSGSPFMSSRPPAGANLNGKSVKDGATSIGVKDIAQPKMPQERPRTEPQHGSNQNQISSANDPGMAPAAKAQVVGWPPIRSFRKNTLAANPKATDESEGKPGSTVLYVKVSMDGAPYLRKVDLKLYSCYLELSTALEKMFSCFTIGQCGSHGVPGRDGLSESKLMDLLHGSEYVLTYEDKDGDWMLCGDVPWEMFIDSCKRLRIMKGSEAIGL
ncbi:hypothetical protein KI387_012426, partial [Taxus chinensis]